MRTPRVRIEFTLLSPVAVPGPCTVHVMAKELIIWIYDATSTALLKGLKHDPSTPRTDS